MLHFLQMAFRGRGRGRGGGRGRGFGSSFDTRIGKHVPYEDFPVSWLIMISWREKPI